MEVREPRRVLRAAVARSVVGVAAVLLVAGCGGDPAAPAAPTATAAATTRVASTSSPAATASAAPAFPAGLPDAAKAHNEAGAQAFVRHFIAELNASWRKPDPALLEPLCSSGLKSCRVYVDYARELQTKGRRYSSDPVSIDKLTPLNEEGSQARILMFSTRTGASVIDTTNIVVDRDTKAKVTRLFYLNWGRSGWLISSIREA